MPIFPPFIPNSWDFLGSKVIVGSAAVTTGNLTLIDPITGAAGTRDELVVISRVVSYSGGGDVASFRFNADAGTNYWDRYVNFAAGSTTVVNTQNVSQTLMRLGISTTKGRSDEITISNLATATKLCGVKTQIGSGVASTAGIAAFGGGEWVNTSAQITSIEMRTSGGSVTMAVGSGFLVFGRNIT
jgi:hypothetical protein